MARTRSQRMSALHVSYWGDERNCYKWDQSVAVDPQRTSHPIFKCASSVSTAQLTLAFDLLDFPLCLGEALRRMLTPMSPGQVPKTKVISTFSTPQAALAPAALHHGIGQKPPGAQLHPLRHTLRWR